MSAELAPTQNFHDMQLRVGDWLQLDPPQPLGLTRLRVQVVGWMDGHSLITTLPRTPTGRLELLENEVVLLRAFTGMCAYAFRCSVLKRASPPFEYLHLSFPHDLEGVTVRSSPRCRVDLPARARTTAGALAVRVEDVSATGARITSQRPLGLAGERVEVAFDFVLHGVPVKLALQADIRSSRADAERGHSYGVSFIEPAPNDTLVLASLVCSKMQANPRLAA